MSSAPDFETDRPTVLVAGGAGFVGSAVVRELLAQGHAVVSYDNYLHGHPDHVAGLLGPFRAVEGDILDRELLERTMRGHGVQYVVDCVGDTFVPDAYVLPERFFDINVNGTLTLLMAARRCGVRRVVYASTTEVYGIREGMAHLDEQVACDPANTYAVSKLAADRLCYTLHVEHGVPVVIARLFNCYGPRETHPYIIPEIIKQLVEGDVVRLGNTAAQRDFTYVHDTARALISLLRSPYPNGQAVNVGSDVCVSVTELFTLLARIMERPDARIEHDPARLRRLDIDWFRCDNRALREATGWRPTIELEEGLRRTVAWYHENGCRWSWEPQPAAAMA